MKVRILITRRKNYSTVTPCARSDAVMAKFHYAIWSQTGSKLVADLQRAEIWPII